MTARRAIPAFTLLLFVLVAAPTFGQVVINEIDYDQVGTDNAEFLELKNIGASPVNLDNYDVQLVNGTGGGATVYDTINLPNVNLAPGDYYVICANATTVINCDLDDGPDTDFIQNGAPDAIGLRLSGTVVDAVSYEGNSGAPYTETTGAPVAQADSNTVAFIGLSRFPDGADTNNNSADLTIRCITPGAPNSAANSGCTAPVPPPTLNISDVTQVETNAGTTTFTFAVTLSAPAGPSGVTFDIATADGTAQDDNPVVSEDNDYVAQSLTAQSIPSGSSGPFNFNVTVNGDVNVEADETFFVNVTNIANATPGDTQGQGTIQNDDTPCASLSIDDVALVETDAGTTTFAFTVSLSQAGCGTVTFDIATQDNTATDADNDYDTQSLTGQTITFPSTYTFNVTVNGDVTQEADQTFFVNITNVSPANVQVTDGQGLGTIVNDDYTRIHDIQGPGNSSPLSGVVTTRGIVTGVKSNGFFIQEPDASVDADPMTSEGIFVFTSSAPPAAATVGNYVEVTGTIAEFVPSSDPLQPPLTELTSSPTTLQLSTGNPLPAAIPLTATFPDPAGPFDQLERLEGMRVSVASLTTSSPTLGNNTNETNATQTSNGVFSGVVTGVPRPAREPGIQDPDPAPSGGTIPPIPRFDANPELIRVDSDGLTGAPILDVNTGATVTGLVGPLDYGFRHYTILPDPTLPAPVATGGMTATSATAPTGTELTVGSYNVERFFDTVNDPAIGEPVLTAGAYDNRLNKLSLGIRNNLLMPDILGMVEVENLTTLQDIAARISADAIAASQPDPQYVAYLSEGNDVGGIDVGFLVKTALVFGTTPRVTVNAVVQENAGEMFVNPDTSTELLNDRPPLRLDAVVNDPNGAAFPVTVIVVHQRSLLGVNNEGAGSNGWPTSGARVRAKRQAQAASLANLVQTRQTNDPAERIILVGDFNAYEFNDGLADTMDTVHGTPPPDNETAVAGDGVDLVTPDLDNLFDTPPAGERYSYVFDGQMQNIDHGIVNAALIAATTARRLEHPRINTDFQAVDRNDPSTARHLSDHDPLVGYFEVAAFASADVSMTKTLDTGGPYFEGQSVTYTLTVANAGPDGATNIQITDTPTNLTITNVSGACASFSPCTIASLASGASTNITVTATIAAPGVFDNSADANGAEPDPNSANNTDNTSNGGTAGATANVSITKTLDTPGLYFAGQPVTYTLVVANAGPSTATNINVTDTPSNLTITNVSGACASFSPCTIASLASGASTNITVTATLDAAGAFDNVASATATENDPNTADNTDNTGNGGGTGPSANVSITKTLDTAGPYLIGQSVTYTIVVANAGPSPATNISVTDTPSNLTITNVSGACTSFSPCTIPPLAPGASTNITVTATIDSSGAFSNAATANATEFDPDTNDNSSSDGDVASQVGIVEVTKSVSGTFVQGTNVTYTVVLTNNMTVTQNDNFGHEFADVLPSQLTFVSVNATSGTAAAVVSNTVITWNGSIPAGGTVTITIVCTINPTASGTVSNQGNSIFDTNGDNQNESEEFSDDPSTAADDDATVFNIIQSNIVEVTKSVSGTFVQGTNVTYTVVLTNNMTVTQNDNFGHEFADVLPSQLTFVSVNATSGTAAAVVSNTVITWNGSIPAGGTVTITIVCTINPTASGTVSNQGNSIFDTNGDNQNESEEFTDDPSTAADDDATVFNIVQANAVTATKSVSGTFVQGSNVTYTIVLTNNMTVTQNDNFGHEATDSLPAGLTFVSANASSGTVTQCCGNPGVVLWNGSIPAGGTVTITIVASIDPTTTGTISNENNAIYDNNGDNQNESETWSDDPSTAAPNDPTSFTVIPAGVVSATKSVSGTFVQGSNVTYTIVVTNNMGIAQADNAGNELTDVLPPSLTLVSATATSGTAVANVGTNTVTWNGTIAANGSVTVTVTAQINNGATGAVSNQSSLAFDADGNGTNESTGVTDDPATGTANDATVFTIATDSDGDGVDDVIEQAAPNSGDGNGDGIPDYTQSSVASIPASTGSGYLTLQSSCALQEVYVTTAGAMPTPDPSHFNYPHGLIAFRAPCSSATFSLFVYGSGAVNAYRKFGPLPPGGPQQWYGIPATFGTATVGSLHPRKIDFSLTDGGTGDDTPVDGVIVDQGGPGGSSDIPTASEWALMAMAAMLAAAALLALKR